MHRDVKKFNRVHSFCQEICVFKRLAAIALVTSLGAFAQTNMRPPQATDKEKIADALMAGPAFITRDAVIADWPANPKDPKAEYRILRAGKSERTSQRGLAGYTHDEP